MITLITEVSEVHSTYINDDDSEGWILHIRWRFEDTNTGHSYTADFTIDSYDIENWIDWPWAMSDGFIEKEEII